MLNLIFSNNLFPITHNDMSDSMVHVIYSFLTKKEVDIAVILCHIIIFEARNSISSRLLPYGVLITHLLEVCGVLFSKYATTLRQGAEIGQLTIQRMLREGTHSKKRKLAKAEGGSFGATTMPPLAAATEPTAPSPPPAPVAPQGEPPVPSFVRGALDGLEELSGRIIGHLEKMDKLNSIELRVERLEHMLAPQLPPHPSVPLDLRTQSDEDEDDDE